MADVLYTVRTMICAHLFYVHVPTDKTWEVIPPGADVQFTKRRRSIIVGGCSRRDNRNGDSFLLLTSGIENPREWIRMYIPIYSDENIFPDAEMSSFSIVIV